MGLGLIYSIRELTEHDVTEYKELRLAALDEDAWAFDSDHAAERDFTDTVWGNILRGRRAFVGSIDNVPVALAEITNMNGQLYLQSVWIAPGSRGTPLTDFLITTVAKQAPTNLALWVGLGNPRARAVYVRNGFVAVRSNEFPGWVLMVRQPG